MLSNLQYLRAFAAINVVYLYVLIGGNSYNKPSKMSFILGEWGANGVDTVSYTHLTLPTIYSV